MPSRSSPPRADRHKLVLGVGGGVEVIDGKAERLRRHFVASHLDMAAEASLVPSSWMSTSCAAPFGVPD